MIFLGHKHSHHQCQLLQQNRTGLDTEPSELAEYFEAFLQDQRMMNNAIYERVLVWSRCELRKVNGDREVHSAENQLDGTFHVHLGYH